MRFDCMLTDVQSNLFSPTVVVVKKIVGLMNMSD